MRGRRWRRYSATALPVLMPTWHRARASMPTTWSRRCRHCALPTRTRHEPVVDAEPGADPVRALVPDPGLVVLGVSAPAAQCAPTPVRCGGAAGCAGRVHRHAAVESRLRG